MGRSVGAYRSDAQGCRPVDRPAIPHVGIWPTPRCPAVLLGLRLSRSQLQGTTSDRRTPSLAGSPRARLIHRGRTPVAGQLPYARLGPRRSCQLILESGGRGCRCETLDRSCLVTQRSTRVTTAMPVVGARLGVERAGGLRSSYLAPLLPRFARDRLRRKAFTRSLRSHSLLERPGASTAACPTSRLPSLRSAAARALTRGTPQRR